MFNPQTLPYDELLGRFWSSVGAPTSKGKCQYQKAIFTTSEEQSLAAKASLQTRQTEAGGRKIHVMVCEAGPWYDAEEYHQKYFEKSG